MYDWLTGVVLGLSAVCAFACFYLLIRDEPAQDRTFAVIGILEVALLGQLLAGCVALFTGVTGSSGSREVSEVLFLSYLVGLAIALPVGVFWSLAERTRAGTAVLLLAVLTVAALQVRLIDIWSAGA